MIQTISFYILSSLLILSALMVVTQRNIFTSALYLGAALSLVAGFFVLLGADFLAASQILLYVGGILVIIAFVVMLSSVQQAKLQPQVNEQWLPALAGCTGLFLIILIGIKRYPFVQQAGRHVPTTDSLGHLLLNELSLPFEAVSLVLLASLTGAILFSRPSKTDEPQSPKNPESQP
jgi:NADH-quinone oxidoreductase subunit J